MTNKTQIDVAARPDLHLRIKTRPLEFEVGGHASFELATDDIHVHVDAIPITLAIPFLARRVVAGAIGPFGVHIRPFEARFRAPDVHARGTIGREAVELDLHCAGECDAQIEIDGKLSEPVGK